MRTAGQLVTVLGVSVAAVSATPAAAVITIKFVLDGRAQNPGHVTGELKFATTGTGVAAVAAYVLTSTSTSVPAQPGNNLLSGGHVAANSFTIAPDYTLTAANFYVTRYPYYLLLNYSTSKENVFQLVSTAVLNFDGFGGVTYTSDAVPEPASWAMLTIGFASIGLAARRRLLPFKRVTA